MALVQLPIWEHVIKHFKSVSGFQGTTGLLVQLTAILLPAICSSRNRWSRERSKSSPTTAFNLQKLLKALEWKVTLKSQSHRSSDHQATTLYPLVCQPVISELVGKNVLVIALVAKIFVELYLNINYGLLKHVDFTLAFSISSLCGTSSSFTTI